MKTTAQPFHGPPIPQFNDSTVQPFNLNPAVEKEETTDGHGLTRIRRGALVSPFGCVSMFRKHIPNPCPSVFIRGLNAVFRFNGSTAPRRPKFRLICLLSLLTLTAGS